jgi:hypothetical protein
MSGRPRLHPECTGSQFYGPHSAKVPRAYTLITPGGMVHYFCDADCLLKTISIEAGMERETGMPVNWCDRRAGAARRR